MKTLSGLAWEIGERTHSSAAVRITVGFIIIDSLAFIFLGECGLGLLDPFDEVIFHGVMIPFSPSFGADLETQGD
jgi:hypothetical protein